jgi:predicted RNase H-like HicB family nuclease
MSKKFTVVIQREKTGYTVSCPDVPGAHGRDDTKKGAVEDIKQSIQRVLKLRQERGLDFNH